MRGNKILYQKQSHGFTVTHQVRGKDLWNLKEQNRVADPRVEGSVGT